MLDIMINSTKAVDLSIQKLEKYTGTISDKIKVVRSQLGITKF